MDRKAFQIQGKDFLCFIGTGGLSIVFFNYCYFKTMTSLSIAAILLYTAPSIVMVLSAVLFREKMSKKKLAALAVTFAGCVCVTGGVDQAALTIGGVMTGLGADTVPLP